MVKPLPTLIPINPQILVSEPIDANIEIISDTEAYETVPVTKPAIDDLKKEKRVRAFGINQSFKTRYW